MGRELIYFIFISLEMYISKSSRGDGSLGKYLGRGDPGAQGWSVDEIRIYIY